MTGQESGHRAPHHESTEPTGPIEDDPNLANERFAGNPIRSYRSVGPLRVVGEVIE